MATENPVVGAQLRHTLVTLFENEAALFNAVRILHQAGFGREKLSILTQDEAALTRIASEADVQDGREKTSAEALAQDVSPKGHDETVGMVIGGTVGMVLGLSAIVIPGFGPFLLATGPLAIALHGATVAAAGVGLGALFGAIMDESVTEEHRDLYERRLAEGYWLLVVHGDDDEIERAGLLLTPIASHLDTF